MRITSPVTRSQKQPSNWNPRPCFPYSLCNFYGAVSTAIKDRLQHSDSASAVFLKHLRK